MKLTKLLDYLFPRRCIFCNTPVYHEHPYCEDCVGLIPFTENVCGICGKSPCICGKYHFSFSAVVSVFSYELGAENAVRQLKFHEHTDYAKPLAEYLYYKLIQCPFYPEIDLIVPVPMTKKAVRRRGYNQSVYLVNHLSKLTALPKDTRHLVKIRSTQNQHDLNGKERRQNLKNAFSVSDNTPFVGKTVLLCDDVYTTGATFDECARTLLAAGAKAVYCLAVASTQLKQTQEEQAAESI